MAMAMAMAMAAQQALSCTLTLPSSLLITLPRPRTSSYSLHSGSKTLGLALGFDRASSAHDQARGQILSRVMSSDAMAMEADDVEYTAFEALTMYVKMEGTLGDATGARVRKSLEGMEGVSNVKFSFGEGAAIVELTKKTNVQATGVASELVDAAQKAGFKVKSLCLGFDDEETSEDDALYFGSSSAIDEAEIAAI